MRRGLAATLALGLILLGQAASARAQGLSLGFSDTYPITDSEAWMKRALSVHTDIVRVHVDWASVAPEHRPAGFDPTSPSSPGYDWMSIDQQVRSLTDHGIKPLLNLAVAPRWAQGGSPPRGTTPGTWRPDAAQYGAFALAAARRYSGSYPDPSHPGSALPRVRLWQAWNEPNLSVYLSPQWTRTRSGYSPTSALIYRNLLNRFYSSLKSVRSSNLVVAAGTAPYGDEPGGQRMQPVPFYRSLLCFTNTGPLRPVSCPDPAHLDAVSSHPYGVGGPLWHAVNPGDVAVPDMYKIVRVLQAAQHARRVLPAGPKHVWVTEISWDSDPPDPQGVPIQLQARRLEQALYVLWRQGVETVLWLTIEDDPCVPDCGSTYQAGLYELSGEAKPAARAFLFPFLSARVSRSRIQLWGRAPASGLLDVQVRRQRRWVVIVRLPVRSGSVFLSSVTESGPATLRAVVDGVASLSWHQGG